MTTRLQAIQEYARQFVCEQFVTYNLGEQQDDETLQLRAQELRSLFDKWKAQDEDLKGEEACCECGEPYPRADLILRSEIFCPAHRG